MSRALFVFLAAVLAARAAFNENGAVWLKRGPRNNNNTIVQLFEWDWTHVASECINYLAPMGYGYAQVSPPMEHIQGSQWWTDYQPVTYNLTSKRGDRSEFASMVSTCNAAGVGIIVDAVLNHMTAGSGAGIAGSPYTKFSYPLYDYADFHHCNNGHDDQIENYDNATEVQDCELSGLADLDSESDYVRGVQGKYLNDLLSLGVAGFRFDAAKHIAPTSLQNIIDRCSSAPYVVQEVIYGAGEAVRPDQYTELGDVFVFQGRSDLKRMFESDGIEFLVTPTPWGSGWGDGYLDSDVAAVFVANHDTERDGTSLRWDSTNNAYVLAYIFLLGFNYGSPSILSGYDFTNFDEGAPAQGCSVNGGGFRCEHRWQAINNMVRFHNTVGSAALGNVVKGINDQQIGFSRGSLGFLIINNSGSSWSGTWTTGLPAGSYCDVIHDTNDSPTSCSGIFYTINSSGQFTATVAAYDAIAIYVGGS